MKVFARVMGTLVVLLCVLFPVSLEQVFGGVPTFDGLPGWTEDHIDPYKDQDFHHGGEEHNEDYAYEDHQDHHLPLDDVHNNGSAFATHSGDGNSTSEPSHHSTVGATAPTGTLRIVRPLQNVTKKVGDTVKLKCEAEGDPPPTRFRWLANDAPLQEKRNKVTVRKLGGGAHGSRLRITELEVHDTGFYTCEASNGKQKVSTTSVVRVEADKWGGGMPGGTTLQNYPHSSFSELDEFSRNLPDDISHSHHSEEEFDHDDDEMGMIGEKGVIFEGGIRPDDLGKSPPAFGGHPGGLAGAGLDMPGPGLGHPGFLPAHLPAHAEEAGCQPYRGKACADYIGNGSVFVTAIGQTMIEKKLSAAFSVIKSSPDLSMRCSEFAKPSLCYTAFPVCSEESGRPRVVCREECELLEQDLCRVEVAIAKRHPSIGQQFVLPDCNSLPPVGSDDSRDCQRLGIPHAHNIVIPEHGCFKDRGQDYRGVESSSASGRPCMAWSMQQSGLKPAEFPELSGGHSFCRNPGGQEQQPWCFVGPSHRELCAIPKCVDNMWLYAVVGAAGVTFIVLLLLLYCCIRLRKSKARRPTHAFPSPRNGGASIGSGIMIPGQQQDSRQLVEMSSLLGSHQKGPRSDGGHSGAGSSSSTGGCRAREFIQEHVRLLQELGEGAFGKVYKGELLLDGMPTPVAVKTLKENATAKTQQDFRREVDLMSDLRHPNIVCLLGVVLRGEPLCMLFEYMAHGDLHEFLMAHSPFNEPEAGEIRRPQLDQADFLHISIQVAAGMEYLSGHHYVHRDLAARNCLVGDNLTVKISDFGLSRDIYSSDYYRVQSKSLLPVRWMPPESILYGKFTTESDVWSYGVVLWETYSYGLQPYYGYSNQEVIDMIRSRQLLPCPDSCPSRIYSLMMECWHEVPYRRPSFPEIHARLRTWSAMPAPTPSHGAPSIGGSSSQRSSTGPSNNTGSTQLSSHHHPHHQAYPQPYASSPFNTFNPNMPAQYNAVQYLRGQQQQACQSPHRGGGQHHVMGSFHGDGKVSNI
ncbi:inactive tyrosine-protein kinase transmembrane receptor ROR1-like isoform X2 [Neocloeon triangulifer]|uniref:inactive tyrosine-protein kinase transmembrane receptor ROR1-like isoform X2 n=1 Tax=Neocloeon triangulifer TaxID=2078957 RepID=UPI00286F6B2D|nr:inactive tyrosine-protein kinase transmembrane receptor ROR1-like isoform X2 [Neocloeon triangulifer]